VLDGASQRLKLIGWCNSPMRSVQGREQTP
jgi:hypothetical protein